MYKERTSEGYEIQTYDEKGNYKNVFGCEDLEDVAKTLISICNGCPKGWFPTVWLNGERIR